MAPASRALVQLLLWLLLCAALPGSSLAAEVALRGEWQALPAAAEGTAGDASAAPRTAFQPGLRTLLVPPPGTRPRQSTVWLHPASGDWPEGRWVLRVERLGLQTVALRDAEGRWQSARLLNPQRDSGLPAHGVLAFDLPRLPTGAQPLELRVVADGVLATPLRLRLVDAATHLEQDTRWLAFTSACLGILLAMGVMALTFAATLRDPVFLSYAGYLAAYGWILCLQTGYAASVLGIGFAPEGVPASGRVATTLSVVFAILFLDRFAGLRRYAPRWRWPLWILLGGILLSGLLSVVSLPSGANLGQTLVNPLLILGGPLLAVVAARAALGGSRYAGIFLLGWLPLLLVTVAGSLQLYGLGTEQDWLADAAFAAAAFESLVFSVGLAQRSVELRRERDQVRRLADLDPLTGLLNRRAWSEQLEARATADRGRPLCLLFLDVDHFKDINDHYGHAAGDSVLKQIARLLRSELRQQDLIARHGGEELIAALPNCSLERASAIAERLRRQVTALPLVAADRRPLRVSVSIGVAAAGRGESLDSLVERADVAMYRAKAAGRDRVEVDSGS